MTFLSKFRIPYSSDRMFGLLLLAILIVPTVIAPQFTINALLFSDPIETVKLIVWSIFVGLALLVLARKSQAVTVLPKYFVWLLLAFVGYGLLMLPFSFDKVNTIFGVAFRMNSSLWFFTVWAAWIFLLSFLEEVKFKVLVRTLLITFFLVAFWAILQSYGIGFYAGLAVADRQLIPSFLGNPNFASMFVASSVPLLFWAVATEKNKVWRLLYVFFGVCSVWSLNLFSSRAAVLGLVAALGVVFVFSAWQRRWKITLIMLGVLTAVVVIGAFYLQVIRPEITSGQTSDTSTVERYYIWNQAVKFIEKRPLSGSGLGNYFIAYRQNQEPHLADISWFDDPHNLILYLAVSGGVPLAIIFIVLLAIPLWQALRLALVDRQHFEPVIWASVIIGWLITASFGPVSVPNWMILGFCLVGLYRSMPAQQTVITKKSVLRLGAILGAVLILVAIAYSASEILFWQAQLQAADQHNDVALKLVRAAVKINPNNAAAPGTWANLARTTQRYSESDQALQFAEEVHPHSAAILQSVLLGYVKLWTDTNDQQYKDKAIQVADRYVASNSNYYITYRDLVTAYLALGETDKALQAAKHQAVINSKDPQAWFLLTQMYRATGQRKQLLAAYRHGFKLKPNPIIGRLLQEAEKQPDVNKIPLPFELASYSN